MCLMPEQNGQYSETIRLVAHDVDYQNKWKMSSIFANVQEVANSQCILHGCGWEDLLHQYNACFVLTRMRFEMEDYPSSGENVTITTWPSASVRAIFTRYFELRRENGEYLGGATSQWALFQKENRSVLKPSDCNIVMPEAVGVEPPVVLPRQSFGFEPDERRFRDPVYSDFDYNGHVNNARYVEWICDLFDVQDFEKKRLRNIDIKYAQEIRCGEHVVLEWRRLPDGQFFVRGKDAEGETVFFSGTGQFS